MEKREELRMRSSVGKRAGRLGIFCNAVLATGKIAVGGVAGSASIVADGMNNLTDAASSVVTLLGFKLAEKPADKQHPYGHARFEYLASLTVSALILVIGFELVKTSVERIIRPVAVAFTPAAVWVLMASILVKLFMTVFYTRAGKKIQSNVLIASAADSRNDMITTAAVAVAGAVEHFARWKVDGAMGLLVSVFILFSGISLAKKTVSPLLGEGADPELRKALTDYIGGCAGVIGCHDLMVHDYGPGRRYASIHVEMNKETDVILCHEMIDRMERECLSRFGVHLVIHYDPVLIGDPETERLKRLVSTILRVRDEGLEMHDFRILPEKEGKVLAFDVTMPEELAGQEERIRTALEQALAQLDSTGYTLRITFDL